MGSCLLLDTLGQCPQLQRCQCHTAKRHQRVPPVGTPCTIHRGPTQRNAAYHFSVCDASQMTDRGRATAPGSGSSAGSVGNRSLSRGAAAGPKLAGGGVGGGGGGPAAFNYSS
jgi:hypothetical protein